MTTEQEQTLFDARTNAMRALARVDAEQREARSAAEKAVIVEFQPRLDAARTAAREADGAYKDFMSDNASDPNEGKTVTRKEGWKKTTIRGRVEIRRRATVFPANAGAYRLPEIGQPFVRLLKGDGTPGLKFERYGPNWTVEQ